MSEDRKVVPLHGGEVAGYEPIESVVTLLRSLLERAERGELISVACGYVWSDGSVGSGWMGANGTKFQRAASVMMLNQRIAMNLIEEGEFSPSTPPAPASP